MPKAAQTDYILEAIRPLVRTEVAIALERQQAKAPPAPAPNTVPTGARLLTVDGVAAGSRSHEAPSGNWFLKVNCHAN